MSKFTNIRRNASAIAIAVAVAAGVIASPASAYYGGGVPAAKAAVASANTCANADARPYYYVGMSAGRWVIINNMRETEDAVICLANVARTAAMSDPLTVGYKATLQKTAEDSAAYRIQNGDSQPVSAWNRAKANGFQALRCVRGDAQVLEGHTWQMAQYGADSPRQAMLEILGDSSQSASVLNPNLISIGVGIIASTPFGAAGSTYILDSSPCAER